jgi:hypothetical protein
MSRTSCGRLLVSAVALGMALGSGALTSGQKQEGWAGVLDEHPTIQYATRPTTDRVAKLNQTLTVKEAVYGRMIDILSGNDVHAGSAHLSADDRRAVLEILGDTKPDFNRFEWSRRLQVSSARHGKAFVFHP